MLLCLWWEGDNLGIYFGFDFGDEVIITIIIVVIGVVGAAECAIAASCSSIERWWKESNVEEDALARLLEHFVGIVASSAAAAAMDVVVLYIIVLEEARIVVTPKCFFGWYYGASAVKTKK